MTKCVNEYIFSIRFQRVNSIFTGINTPGFELSISHHTFRLLFYAQKLYLLKADNKSISLRMFSTYEKHVDVFYQT